MKKNKMLNIIGGMGLFFFGIGLLIYICTFFFKSALTSNYEGMEYVIIFFGMYSSIVWGYIVYLKKKHKKN